MNSRPTSPKKIIAATTLAFAVVFYSAQTSHAEFLDDLFGGDDAAPSQARPSYKPRQRSNSSFGVQTFNERRSRHRNTAETGHQAKIDNPSEEAAKNEKAKYEKLALCVPHEEKEQISKDHNAVLFDKSLKQGDSVMTPSGVHVFKGQNSCPHAAGDFVPVTQHRSKRHGSALLAIDTASKQPRK